jgi:hypothetical protein
MCRNGIFVPLVSKPAIRLSDSMRKTPQLLYLIDLKSRVCYPNKVGNRNIAVFLPISSKNKRENKQNANLRRQRQV